MDILERLKNLGVKLKAAGGNIQYSIPETCDKLEARGLLKQLAIPDIKQKAIKYLIENQPKIVAVDIETTGLDAMTCDIKLISVADEHGVYIYEKVDFIKEILLNKNITKIFHNAAFDVYFLESKGFDVINYTDTMIINKVLTNNEGEHKLAHLVNDYFKVTLDKTLQKGDNWTGNISQEHIFYCMKDAYYTYELYLKLMGKIEEAGLQPVLNLELDALPAIIRLKRDGIPFDKEAWLIEVSRYRNEANELAAEIREQLNAPSLNLSSSGQLVKALKNIDIEIADTEDETLMAYEHDSEVIRKIRVWREKNKIVVSFGEKLAAKVSADGRIHGNWQLIGTKTGRMSASSPGLQQMPKVVKEFFRAQPGNTFIISDFSQIELCVIAELSRDPNMVAALNVGADLHIETSAKLQGIDPSMVSKEDRSVAKEANFGLIYGMMASTLKERVKNRYKIELSDAEAKKIRDDYFKHYNGVRRYHDRQLKSFTITTLGGRVWRNVPKYPEKGWRNRYNYPVQGTAAEGFKKAVIRLLKAIRPNWKLCAFVHDEIVMEVPETEAEIAKNILEKAMVDGMREFIKSVPIKVETSINKYWKK